MRKRDLLFAAAFSLLIGISSSCKDEETNRIKEDAYTVHVDKLSPEMQKVRDYVPKFATIAHRGSTFWTPEETEASYRWAREIGADYLEADLQISKDGVILALHDDNLKRTTNIENVFGEDLPAGRFDYYVHDLGYSVAEATAKVAEDRKNFIPNLTSFYTYKELLQLDAGTWFNEDNPEQARAGFSRNKQYISSLEDLVMYAKGKMLKRDANGNRIYSITGKGGKVSSLSGEADVAIYEFEYEDDLVGNSGNRPGIYLEFKESWLNPSDFEKRVYDELDRLDMNIITKPENSNAPFYVNNKVNVGNTNGKVILQTFSLSSLVRVADLYKGKVPMCFLLWKGNGATDINNDTPTGYASFINLGIKHLAHIIGPSIAGAPNNYPELNYPWQDYLIKRAEMLNHPYSFDTREQMSKYFGDYNFGNTGKDLFKAPYLDAAFTNRTEMTLKYFIDKGVRLSGAPTVVPESSALLDKLGYTIK